MVNPTRLLLATGLLLALSGTATSQGTTARLCGTWKLDADATRKLRSDSPAIPIELTISKTGQAKLVLLGSSIDDATHVGKWTVRREFADEKMNPSLDVQFTWGGNGRKVQVSFTFLPDGTMQASEGKQKTLWRRAKEK